MSDLPEKLIGGTWSVEGEVFDDSYLRHVLCMIRTNIPFGKSRKADRALQLLKKHGAIRFNAIARKWEIV